jgi:hypothetical protein
MQQQQQQQQSVVAYGTCRGNYTACVRRMAVLRQLTSMLCSCQVNLYNVTGPAYPMNAMRTFQCLAAVQHDMDCCATAACLAWLAEQLCSSRD